MPELTRPLSEAFGSGGGGLFDDNTATGIATVSNSGLYTERLPVANMTVREVRARFGDRLDIDPHSQAEIDGRPVTDDVVIRANQLVTFVRHAGEKGMPV
jgi:hypothetical protein